MKSSAQANTSHETLIYIQNERDAKRFFFLPRLKMTGIQKAIDFQLCKQNHLFFSLLRRPQINTISTASFPGVLPRGNEATEILARCADAFTVCYSSREDHLLLGATRELNFICWHRFNGSFRNRAGGAGSSMQAIDR